MQELKKRYIILTGILLAFLAIVSAIELHTAVRLIRTNVFNIPLHISGWDGREIETSDETRSILETSSVLMREYKKDGRRILLAIVCYKDSRVALHLPESCYSGQGSHIIDRRREPLGDFTANTFLLDGNKGKIMVLYYFTTGGFSTGSYAAMRWRMLRDKLMGKDIGCALVRLSTTLTAGQDNDLKAAKEFARNINIVLPQYLK